MNKATKNLEEDHVSILRLIEVMEQWTKRSDPDINHLETIINIIRGFADGIHHAKEELKLFPFLIRNGFRLESGPVAVMLAEHVAGRNFVKAMSLASERYKSGNLSALADIRANMLNYAELLKNHIGKENMVLFRMADNLMLESVQASMFADFLKAENHTETGITKSMYLEKIGQLHQFYS